MKQSTPSPTVNKNSTADRAAAAVAAAAFLKNETNTARRSLGLAGGFILLSGLCLVAAAWLFARLVNGLIFPTPDAPVLPWPIAGLLLLLYAGKALFGALAERQALRGAQQVKENLRRRVTRHMFKISSLHREQTGSFMNHYVEGLEALQTYYAGYLPARMSAAFIPLAVLVALVPADWLSALAMLLTLPLVPVFMILVGRGAERLNQRQWKKLSFMSGYFIDLLQGLTTLKLFNASRAEAAYLAQVGEDYTRDTMAVLRVAFLSSLVLEFFATVSIAVIAVTVGFRLLWGEIAFLNGFYVLLLAPELYLPLRRLGIHYHARMEAIAAAGHIQDFLALPALPEESSGVLPDAPLAVRFEKVSFTYPDGRVGLQDVSFDLMPGSLTLLAGASGSGKSTIQLLLMKLAVPTAGRILINGIDLQKIDKDAWWQQLGWVPQKARLFTGTIGSQISDNPAIAEQLAEQLGINWQADILNQSVGEAAQNLSGGQVQRIALARALARQPQLLLLDEPMANLDAQSAQLVEAAVQQSHMLRIMATHHLAYSDKADQIILLEKGRVVASGTPAIMLHQSSYYRDCLKHPGQVIA